MENIISHTQQGKQSLKKDGKELEQSEFFHDLDYFSELENRADFLIRLEMLLDSLPDYKRSDTARYCVEITHKRFITKQEAMLKLNRLISLDDDRHLTTVETEAWLNELHKATRRESRVRKKARPAARLKAYLKKMLRQRNKESWTYCPSYKDLAKWLDLSESTISRAFRELEEEDTELSFKSGYPDGSKRKRVKFVCLVKWLDFDELPLHYEKSGRERHIWDNFRKDSAKHTAKKPVNAEEQEEVKAQISEEQKTEICFKKEMGNCQKCLPDPIRLPSKEERQQFTQYEAKASPNKINKKPKGLQGLRKTSRFLASEHTARFFDDETSEFRRVHFSFEQIYNAIFYAMKLGVWRDDIEFCLRRSHEILERDIEDGMPENANRYWWGIYKAHLGTKKQSINQCHTRAKQHWEENFFTPKAIEESNNLYDALKLTKEERAKSIAKKQSIAERYGIEYNYAI